MAEEIRTVDKLREVFRNTPVADIIEQGARPPKTENGIYKLHGIVLTESERLHMANWTRQNLVGTQVMMVYAMLGSVTSINEDIPRRGKSPGDE